MSTQNEGEHREVGFVYVLSNPCLHGLLKIGVTSLLPEDRAGDLSRTAVPDDFVVMFRRMVSRPRAVEKKAHDLLDVYHYKKEFFEVSVDDAVKAVTTAAVEIDGIASWPDESVQAIRAGDRVALSLRDGEIFVLLRRMEPMDALIGRPQLVDVWQAHATGDLVELHARASGSDVVSFSDDDDRAMIDPVPFLDRANLAPNGAINGQEGLLPGDRLVWLAAPHAPVPDRAVFEAVDHCQVVSRTWDPRLSSEGVPLLLNHFNHDFEHGGFPAWMRPAVREVMDMPQPRLWVVRMESETDGRERPPPESWLPHLAPRRRRRSPDQGDVA